MWSRQSGYRATLRLRLRLQQSNDGRVVPQFASVRGTTGGSVDCWLHPVCLFLHYVDWPVRSYAGASGRNGPRSSVGAGVARRLRSVRLSRWFPHDNARRASFLPRDFSGLETMVVLSSARTHSRCPGRHRTGGVRVRRSRLGPSLRSKDLRIGPPWRGRRLTSADRLRRPLSADVRLTEGTACRWVLTTVLDGNAADSLGARTPADAADMRPTIGRRVRVQANALSPGWHEGMFNATRTEPACYVIVFFKPRSSRTAAIELSSTVYVRDVSALHVYTGEQQPIQDSAGVAAESAADVWPPVPPAVLLKASGVCSPATPELPVPLPSNGSR